MSERKAGVVIWLEQLQPILDAVIELGTEERHGELEFPLDYVFSYADIGMVFYDFIAYAIDEENILHSPDDEDLADNAWSKEMKLLWKTLKRMADDAENVYQRRVEKKKAQIEHLDEARRLA